MCRDIFQNLCALLSSRKFAQMFYLVVNVSVRVVVGDTHLGRVFILAVVHVSHNGLLLPHPTLSLVCISKVLLCLQGVLQIMGPLAGLVLYTHTDIIQMLR